MLIQRSFILKPDNDTKKWYHIDAQDMVLGRLATEVARILRGKNSPAYTPNVDSGDYVVITNCEKIKLTGNKWEDKSYFWHTNHIGGIKSRSARVQLEKHPELIIMEAVKGMLPKNTLGRKQLKKLRVYKGASHENDAQKPETIVLK
ncbi:MAG: 50S ribosomal protein L13 [Oligoflexia bacterium]|nr:50S ribosomal protein L13 [Oligoflexia bacterium]